MADVDVIERLRSYPEQKQKCFQELKRIREEGTIDVNVKLISDCKKRIDKLKKRSDEVISDISKASQLIQESWYGEGYSSYDEGDYFMFQIDKKLEDFSEVLGTTSNILQGIIDTYQHMDCSAAKVLGSKIDL